MFTGDLAVRLTRIESIKEEEDLVWGSSDGRRVTLTLIISRNQNPDEDGCPIQCHTNYSEIDYEVNPSQCRKVEIPTSEARANIIQSFKEACMEQCYSGVTQVLTQQASFLSYLSSKETFDIASLHLGNPSEALGIISERMFPLIPAKQEDVHMCGYTIFNKYSNIINETKASILSTTYNISDTISETNFELASTLGKACGADIILATLFCTMIYTAENPVRALNSGLTQESAELFRVTKWAMLRDYVAFCDSVISSGLTLTVFTQVPQTLSLRAPQASFFTSEDKVGDIPDINIKKEEITSEAEAIPNKIINKINDERRLTYDEIAEVQQGSITKKRPGKSRQEFLAESKRAAIKRREEASARWASSFREGEARNPFDIINDNPEGKTVLPGAKPVGLRGLMDCVGFQFGFKSGETTKEQRCPPADDPGENTCAAAFILALKAFAENSEVVIQMLAKAYQNSQGSDSDASLDGSVGKRAQEAPSAQLRPFQVLCDIITTNTGRFAAFTWRGVPRSEASATECHETDIAQRTAAWAFLQGFIQGTQNLRSILFQPVANREDLRVAMRSRRLLLVSYVKKFLEPIIYN